MKKLKLSIAMLSLLAVAACKKSTTDPNGGVTTDDAADMVTGSLAANSNGISDISADVATDANYVSGFSVSGPTVNTLGTTRMQCGETKTNTFSRISAPGATVTFNFNASYTHTLNCVNQQADNLTTHGTFAGSYNGPHIKTNDNGTIQFNIAGLGHTATAYDINGEITRSGSYKSKPDTTKAGSHSLDLVVKDLMISKSTKKITGGTGTLTLSGKSNKGSFNYTGTLTFIGEGKATLTINGVKYTINLEIGEKIKA